VTTTSVSGKLQLLTGFDDASATAWGDGTRVTFAGAGTASVTEEFTGTSLYSMSGVLQSPRTRALLEPLVTGDVLPTLRFIDTRIATNRALNLVRSTSLDLALSQLSFAPTVNTQSAQIVLAAIDPDTSLPLAGVKIKAAAAQFIAYQLPSGAWSDLVSETGTSGLAMLVNVTVAATGSTFIDASASGAYTGSFQIEARPGTVTFDRIGGS